MFSRGPRVTVPDPDEDGQIAAACQEIDPSRPGEIEDPRMVGGKRPADQAWAVYAEGEHEGTRGLVPWEQIRPAE